MRDLTELSRIESGEAAPRFATVQVGKVIEGAIEAYLPEARAKDQELKSEIAADLPALQADEGQIRHVLDNLLSNALRNTPRGGSIHIEAVRHDDYVAISVADTGSGIPQEYLGRLFTRFLSVPDTQSGGTGLGLAISRRLVEGHNGQISARSEIGLGTTVTFTLPIVR